MGLFSFFNRKNSNGFEITNPSTTQTTPDIPESIFIEKEARDNAGEKKDLPGNENGITLLFQFLNVNREGQGYDDALINPDSSHLQQNTESIKNELERTIRKVKTFYEDFIAEVDFHITSRSRNGMIDTVEELNMKREIAESHLNKVLEIEDDNRNNRGDSLGIIMSYTRGFKNGLAAISHHNLLKRKF